LSIDRFRVGNFPSLRKFRSLRESLSLVTASPTRLVSKDRAPLSGFSPEPAGHSCALLTYVSRRSRRAGLPRNTNLFLRVASALSPRRRFLLPGDLFELRQVIEIVSSQHADYGPD
jgi:hypothetical protein